MSQLEMFILNTFKHDERNKTQFEHFLYYRDVYNDIPLGHEENNQVKINHVRSPSLPY